MSLKIPKTMVHQLHEVAERLKDEPALWTKRGESWVPTSWRQYAQRVRDFALGLQSLGFAPKQALTVMGFNREEWVVAALASMASGGVGVGVYTTASAEQVAYVTGHCEASIALVENEGYLETLLSVRGQLPALKHIIVMDAPAVPREGVLTFAEVLELGARANEADYYARLEALDPQTLAQLIYTSGTTGHPKGVMLSHHNLCWTTVQLSRCHPIALGDTIVSYLPLSHIAEQVCSIYGPLINGLQVYFAQSFEKLPENLREVRPTLFLGVPRVWEKFKAKAEAGIATQPKNRRRVLAWARSVATRFHDDAMSHRQSSITLQAQYALAQRLVFAPLKARIGLDQAHLLATSAAPIAKEVLEFFASLDLPIAEIYGQSEVTGPTSVSARGAMKLGKLGRPMPGVEVRIAEDGEILVRGGNVCMGYFKDEVATAELIQNGWLHSGDVGVLDEDGFLQITGRKKEIIVTSGGKKTSPSNLEGLLKGIDPIGNAMVVGDGRNYLVALLAIDPERVVAFAKKKGFPLEPRALVSSEPFKAYLREAIDREVNPRVARFESIKRFEVLPHDFTIEGGELTSTLKVRRKIVAQKYEAAIERLYLK
ncbi:MAG: AMP-dependent synthetase/ligase [Archangium sp.]|nr:AMP-dependent synthetase/ligase [Archangium sp.]MDP3155135.1 AMP-dependent synthetase/ligase [Archangium sp.]MDP3573354.1 AMP-dependent synthetase/ligase [Archangium sp.]